MQKYAFLNSSNKQLFNERNQFNTYEINKDNDENFNRYAHYTYNLQTKANDSSFYKRNGKNSDNSYHINLIKVKSKDKTDSDCINLNNTKSINTNHDITNYSDPLLSTL